VQALLCAFQFVPYRDAPAVQDMMAGQIDMMAADRRPGSSSK